MANADQKSRVAIETTIASAIGYAGESDAANAETAAPTPFLWCFLTALTIPHPRKKAPASAIRM